MNHIQHLSQSLSVKMNIFSHFLRYLQQTLSTTNTTRYSGIDDFCVCSDNIIFKYRVKDFDSKWVNRLQNKHRCKIKTVRANLVVALSWIQSLQRVFQVRIFKNSMVMIIIFVVFLKFVPRNLSTSNIDDIEQDIKFNSIQNKLRNADTSIFLII